ncbi:MAG TPA: glycosyltransferase family 39 protein, partial [Vicinamibacteria bacterium]|nr:glycosyltransferase family 39 protein [Vicinamibacteria bacterium]
MPRLAHALIVVLVALTVRTAFQRSAEAYPRLEMIRNALDDQVLYVTWAAALAQGAAMDWADTGHEFAYWAPRWPGVHPQDPGYVYALAAVFRAAGFAFDAIRALQAALGAGTALLAWTLARRHVGPGAALAAGVAAALYQPLVFYEATLLREPLATFLCAAALVACSAAEAGATRRRAVLAALGAGLLLGLAVLVRSHLALPAAAIAAWLLVSTRRRLGAGVALALAFAAALPVLPVVAGNVARSGRPAFVSSAGPYNLFIGNVHDGGGAASPHYHAVKAQGPPQAVDLLAALRDDVAAHPGAFAARLVDKVRVLLGPAEVPDNLSVAMGRRLAGALKVAVVTDAVLLPAALVGMALAGAAWRRHALLYVYALGYAASVVPFVVVSRLRQPLLPVLAVFAALALQQIVAWARARRTRWRAALA